MSGTCKAIGLAFLVFAIGTPAASDWLVMTDGSRVETKGPWKVKGAMVVFTVPNGTYSSVRAREVDVDASHEATAAALRAKEAAAEPPPPPPPPRPPVAVLTDADIKRAEPAAAAAEGEADSSAAAAVAAGAGQLTAAQIGVDVASWAQEESAEGGIEVSGRLRNGGQRIAENLDVLVSLYDDEGNLLQTAPAFIDESRLAPGRTTNFRALFPDIAFAAGEPSFQVRGSGPIFGDVIGISRPGEAGLEDDDAETEEEP